MHALDLPFDDWTRLCQVTRLVRFPLRVPAYFRPYRLALLRASDLPALAAKVAALDDGQLHALHASLREHQDYVAFLRT